MSGGNFGGEAGNAFMKGKKGATISTLGFILSLAALRHYGKYSGPSMRATHGTGTAKPKVDRAFLLRVLRLSKVMVPGVLSPEAGFLAGVAGLLLLRTYLDITMLELTTTVERAIVQRDAGSFGHGVRTFAKFMVPLSIVNSLLKYGQSEVALRFRQRLTAHIMDRYMAGFTYYGVTNLDGRLKNVDQAITQDVELFAESMADLFSNVTKPVLDICLYVRRLARRVDPLAPYSLIAYLLASGVALTAMRKPTGLYTALVQHQEGVYRHVNGRLITHAEEIAFYGGNKKEKAVLSAAFADLVALVRRSQQFRYSMAVVDSIAAKYLASVVGWLTVSRPFLNLKDPRFKDASPSVLYQEYHSAGRMMLNLSQALGRLVLSGRELTRLSGFSARVTSLLDVIEDVAQGSYHRTQVRASPLPPTGTPKTPKSYPATPVATARTPLKNPSSPALSAASGAAEKLLGDAGVEDDESGGVVEESERVIEFDGVPLMTPNGDVLVRSLTFRVESGMNVLVAGPNGCGKSSLFRLLGGLWPVRGGRLVKPMRSKMFYVPQRPYLALGSLREQVLYPQAVDSRASAADDEHLLAVMQQVKLEYLLDREGGWDAVKDWADVLSGGEKQRLAMARMLYNKPLFAILDECTSAVSVDVEGSIYTLARELGITLFTVSHRRSLWQYHDFLLMFDGRGGYEFKRISDQEQAFGS